MDFSEPEYPVKYSDGIYRIPPPPLVIRAFIGTFGSIAQQEISEWMYATYSKDSFVLPEFEDIFFPEKIKRVKLTGDEKRERENRRAREKRNKDKERKRKEESYAHIEARRGMEERKEPQIEESFPNPSHFHRLLYARDLVVKKHCPFGIAAKAAGISFEDMKTVVDYLYQEAGMEHPIWE